MAKADRDELQELYTKLTKQQIEFVHNFIAQDFKNATLAYCNAYPGSTEEAARVSASRLLTAPNIKRCIAMEIEALMAEAKIPLEKKIFETYLARAFYDPADIINSNGGLICSMADLKNKGLSICIVNVDKRIDKNGGEHPVYILADRDKALDMLQKYIAMIKPLSQNVSGTDGHGNPFAFTVEFLKPEEGDQNGTQI